MSSQYSLEQNQSGKNRKFEQEGDVPYSKTKVKSQFLDDHQWIDPRILEVERAAEINFLKQKEAEKQYTYQKEREQEIIKRREETDSIKRRILDVRIGEYQAKYLFEKTQLENRMAEKQFKKVSSLYTNNQYSNYNNFNLDDQATYSHNKQRDNISFRANQAKPVQSEIKITPLVQKLQKEAELPSKNKNILMLNSEEEQEPDYSKLLVKARYLISAKNLDEAESLLEQILIKIPYHVDCLFLLAEVKRFLGKYRESEILYEKCMQQDNFTPLCYKSLAEVLMINRSYIDAAFYIRKYLLYKKDEEEAITLLGRCLMSQREPTEASLCFNRAIELNPDKLENYLRRSQASKALGLHETSQRDYMHFMKNKNHYLEQLSELAPRLRAAGKVMESDQIIDLMNMLVPIN